MSRCGPIALFAAALLLGTDAASDAVAQTASVEVVVTADVGGAAFARLLRSEPQGRRRVYVPNELDVLHEDFLKTHCFVPVAAQGMVAAYGPPRRSLRIQPAEAVRTE